MPRFYQVVDSGVPGACGSEQWGSACMAGRGQAPEGPLCLAEVFRLSPRTRPSLPEFGLQGICRAVCQEDWSAHLMRVNGMAPEAWSCEKEQEWGPGWDLNNWPGPVADCLWDIKEE